MQAFVRRALWVLPALCIAAGALVVNDRLWVPRVVGMRGGLSRSTPATVALLAFPLLTVFYALTFTWLFTMVMPGGRAGMREPSEAEQGCAVVLSRALVVLAMYAIAVLMWFMT